MPRPPKNYYRLRELNEDLIRTKNCIKAAITTTDQSIVEFAKQFKSKVEEMDKSMFVIIIDLNNSWKGFAMFLLALSYARYGSRIEGMLMESGQGTITVIDTNWQRLNKSNSKNWPEPIEEVPHLKDAKPLYVRWLYGTTPSNVFKTIINLCSLLGVSFNPSVFIVEKPAKPYKQYPIDIDKLTQAQIHTVSDEEFPLLILEGQQETITDTLSILQRDQLWKESQVKDKAIEINKTFFYKYSSVLDEGACNKLLSTTDSKCVIYYLGKLLSEWKKLKEEAQSGQDEMKAAEQRLQELDAEIKKIKQDRK